MSRHRQRRILELLDETLERPGAEQAAFLAEACAEDATLRRDVEALLEPPGDAGILATPAFSVHSAETGVGRAIGPYKLVRLLDRGGMGTVYLAQREDFEQRVALKLIRRGLDVDDVFVRRFHNERQILARLEHPGIARLLDGGTTADQLPYFVMEMVEGEPIDRYCSARRLAVGARLRLFRKVCSAVQFAHQNLVIHRDLKPANILIAAGGQPKLLDFGIAKLLDDGLTARPLHTAPGQSPMTFRYASPEQIRIEPITTASDIYSLGVLLYELLTGLFPYHVDSDRSDEVARAICEREPDRPSTAVRLWAQPGDDSAADAGKLGRRLAGDLDSIVLKALRKEPQERYSSVEQLSADIRRHLLGEPVLARAGTFTYRAGKFLRRNRTALGVATAFLVLVVSLAVVSRQVAREREQVGRERQKAENERRGAERVLGFVEDLFRIAGPDQAAKREMTAFELLLRGKEKISTDLEDEPEIQIEVAGTLGQVLHQIGAFAEAKEMMELALRGARRHYPDDPSQVAKRLGNLAVLLFESDDLAGAESHWREALAILQDLGQQTDSKYLRIQNNLASLLLFRGELDAAETRYREVLRRRREVHGRDHKNVATSHRHLGAVLYAKGDLAAAEAELRQALRIRRERLEPDHTAVASVLNLLGKVLAARGAEDVALDLYEEALAIRREKHGEGHPDIARTERNLAALLARTDPASALSFSTRALATFDDAGGGWESADAESVHGAVLAALGQAAAAEAALVRGYESLAELRGEHNLRTRQALDRIIDLYAAQGREAELERYRALRDAQRRSQDRQE